MRTDSILRCAALALLCVGLLIPAAARAQGPKLGIVDTKRAAAYSKEGKAADQALSKLRDTKREEFRDDQEELKRLTEEYETQRFVLSADALQDREIQIMKRRRDLERDLTAAQEEFEIEQRKLMQPILKNILRVVSKVGKKDGFDVILEKTSPGVLFYNDAIDITDRVIEGLNEG